MNTKLNRKTYPYDEAYTIATKVIEQLKPYCERIEIAGSIRRKKSQIGDIEIVAIPKEYGPNDGIAAIVNQWPKVKGEMIFGKTKYTQRVLPEGIKLDLFFATKENWGSILAIRTGSADFSHRVLACGWVKQGYKSESGFLFKNGQKFEVHEEKDLFQIIGIPYVEPEDRDYKNY